MRDAEADGESFEETDGIGVAVDGGDSVTDALTVEDTDGECVLEGEAEGEAEDDDERVTDGEPESVTAPPVTVMTLVTVVGALGEAVVVTVDDSEEVTVAVVGGVLEPRTLSVLTVVAPPLADAVIEPVFVTDDERDALFFGVAVTLLVTVLTTVNEGFNDGEPDGEVEMLAELVLIAEIVKVTDTVMVAEGVAEPVDVDETAAESVDDDVTHAVRLAVGEGVAEPSRLVGETVLVTVAVLLTVGVGVPEGEPDADGEGVADGVTE